MIFGWKLIRESEFERLKRFEIYAMNISEASRWLSGWQDLDIIWTYIRGNSRNVISDVRKQYAEARNTDVYGKELE